MKKNLIALSVVLASFTNPPSNPIERLGIKGPLQFSKTAFSLAWTDKPNTTYYVQEYVPAGESIDRFTQLLTVNLFAKDVAVENAARQKTAELQARKTTDAICNYAVTKSHDGKEYIVDFLLSESKGGEMTIVEFNAYRYRQIDVSGKKALLVYAYSKRSYGAAIPGFLTRLKSERSGLLSTMATTQMPVIKLNGN